MLLDHLQPLLAPIFDRIKLEVLDKEKEEEVTAEITEFVRGMHNLQDTPGVKTTIDIETIFAMLEGFLRKNKPDLKITDLEGLPKQTVPLSFEENLLKTIREYEALRDCSSDPKQKRTYQELIDTLLQ